MPQVNDKLYNVVSSTLCHERDSNSQPLAVIGTDCIGSCKFNYHTITTAPEAEYMLFVYVIYVMHFD